MRQVCGRAVGDPDAGPEASRRLFYYTLHVTLMSAPFYTSEALSGCDTDWQVLTALEIEFTVIEIELERNTTSH